MTVAEAVRQLQINAAMIAGLGCDLTDTTSTLLSSALRTEEQKVWVA